MNIKTYVAYGTLCYKNMLSIEMQFKNKKYLLLWQFMQIKSKKIDKKMKVVENTGVLAL